MKKLRAGIDNYCLYLLKLMPMEMIRWAYENGAEGVAFSGYDDEARELFTSSYLRDTKDLADDLGLYVEWGNGQHVPIDLTSFTPKEIYNSNRRAVGEAYGLGINIVRSCSGGLMRWQKDSPPTEQMLRDTARELKKQASLFRDNGVILAIETHFEFTTSELLALFDMCETEPGDYLGICLDTMNLLTMLEDPVLATERILPWVVSSHIKDGGVVRENEALVTFPAAFGKGIIDFEKIIRMLLSTGRQINLSVEDHGGHFMLPVIEEWFIDRFPDLSGSELKRIYELCDLTSEKILNKELCITNRTEWPAICEERTRKDLADLKRFRDRIIVSDASGIQI
ncbi:MAG: TIM barrel protein [Bacteroidales bacterium]|jgi:sugar phosphate isomerase/epimerase